MQRHTTRRAPAPTVSGSLPRPALQPFGAPISQQNPPPGYQNMASHDATSLSRVSANTTYSSNNMTDLDILDQAIQITQDVRLDGPNMSLEEMIDQMLAEGHELPEIPDFTIDDAETTGVSMTEMDFDFTFSGSTHPDGQNDGNVNVSTRQRGQDYTVEAYTTPSNIQPTPPWNGPNMFSNGTQNQSQWQVRNDAEIQVNQFLPTVQTVGNKTGPINYNIKQVLRKDKQRYLVAFKANPVTGARRNHEWIPASRTYEIPQDLVLKYSQNKLNWINDELRRTGRNPRFAEFQAEEIDG